MQPGTSHVGWTFNKYIICAFVGSLFFFSFIYYVFPDSSGKSDPVVTTIPNSNYLADSSPSSSPSSSNSLSSSSSTSLTDHIPISLKSLPSSSHSLSSHETTTITKTKLRGHLDADEISVLKKSKRIIPPTHFPGLMFPPDDGKQFFDLLLDVRPETDVLLQSQAIPESERINRLQRWFTRNGAEFQGFEFRTIAPEYRGVFATEDLPAGYRFMWVPEICILNAKYFNTSMIAKLIHLYKTDFQPYDHLYIFYWYVLIERFNPYSYWRYWIATLPLHYRTIPLFWDHDTLEVVKGTAIYKSVKDELESSKAEYDLYTELVPALKVFTLEQYRWASRAVGSRIWGHGGGDTNIALMDMINHIQPEVMLDHEWDWDGSGYRLTKDVKKGEQLYFHYGHRSQTDWLTHYGFTAPHNEEWNYIYIKISMWNTSDPLMEQKTQGIGGYVEMECDLTMPYDMSGTGHACWAMARMAVYQGKDVSLFSPQMGPTSPYEELAALEWLSIYCKYYLKTNYITSLEHDLNILKQNPNLIGTNFNYYNSLIALSDEKQILHYYITLFELFYQLISQLEKLPNSQTFLGDSYITLSEENILWNILPAESGQTKESNRRRRLLSLSNMNTTTTTHTETESQRLFRRRLLSLSDNILIQLQDFQPKNNNHTKIHLNQKSESNNIKLSSSSHDDTQHRVRHLLSKDTTAEKRKKIIQEFLEKTIQPLDNKWITQYFNTVLVVLFPENA